MHGPNHKASLNPKNFSNYIQKLNTTKKIYGNFKDKLLPVKKNMKTTSSKSIVLKRDLKNGSKITIKDIIMKRPGKGLNDFFISEIKGKRVKKI